MCFTDVMDLQIGDLINKNVYISLAVGCLLSSFVTYFVLARSKKPENTVPIMQVSAGETKNLTASENIVVDLGGAVKTPGVYKLPAESRVVDLIKAGGGVLGQASNVWVSKNLNLSMKLKDSQKIYVPFDWDLSNDSNSMNYDDAVDFIYNQAESSPSSYVVSDSNSGPGLVNINTATANELDSLPGIGAVYAKKVVDLRPYKDFAELGDKTKIPQSLLDKIKNLIEF